MTKQNKWHKLELLPEGFFLVEGQSALGEYVKFKPSALQWLAYKALPPRALLAQCPPSIPVHTYGDLPLQRRYSESPVWGVVKEEALSEVAWLDTLGVAVQAKSSPPLLIALDHITDPRNLGAMLRTAAFFGVPYMVVCRDRQVLLTQASVNTAQGGLALCQLVTVTNLSRTLGELKGMGYWIIGADMDGESFKKVSGFYEKTVLVLGSEEKGLSPLVRRQCDRIVSIPAGGVSHLDSLNVSVAAGILISDFAAHDPSAR